MKLLQKVRHHIFKRSVYYCKLRITHRTVQDESGWTDSASIVDLKRN